MYHRVAALSPDVHGLCIAPDVFREQMLTIRQHYPFVALAEMNDALVSGEPLPKGVAVTFDDGCLDNLTVASAILQELDVPATFFIPTDRLAEKHEFWWDTLERIFTSSEVLPAELTLNLPTPRVLPTSNKDERLAAHFSLAERMRGLPIGARDALLEKISTWAGIDLTPRDTHRPMLRDELRELASRPKHTIGSHTVHHLSLPVQPVTAQLGELLDSKQILEGLVGKRIRAFAYPYGAVVESTRKLVEGVYECAVTTTAGAASSETHCLEVPRIDANQFTGAGLLGAIASVIGDDRT
jgi:peptidoglycan/xylan/chitin deacetylase (PgdA/CDA1 family)